jgi:hypothetical protein
VEAEVYVETKPMHLCSLLLLSLLLLFLTMLIMMVLFMEHDERVLELGIAAYIFTVITKHGSTIQAIWRGILLLIQRPIFELNLHVTTHFHSFDILHWKQITVPHVL